MTSDRELDLVLRRWIASDLPPRAPAGAVRAALADVAVTPQRRGRPAIRSDVPVLRRSLGWLTWRRAWVVALLAATAIGVVIGMGALQQQPDPSPTPTASESPGPVPSTPSSGRQIDVPELGLELKVPRDWQRDTSRTTVALVSRENPAGQLSVYHGSPLQMVLCDPACATIELTDYLPQAPERTVGEITTVLSQRTGSTEWHPAQGVSGRIRGARQLDVVTGQPPVRRSYLVGTYLSEIVVAVVTMPDSRDAPGDTSSLLAGVQPYPAGFSPLGRPIQHVDPDAGIEVDVPDIWPLDPPPAAAGVKSFGEGRVTIAVQDAAGALSICDPWCRTITASDLASLESATFRSGGAGIVSGTVMISGRPGRYQRIDAPESASYRAIAVTSGRLIHLWVDLSRDVVDPSIAVDIAESFDYLPAAPAVREGNLLVGGGFELRLPAFWRGPWDAALDGSISATSGDDAGRLWNCRWSGFSSSLIPCEIVEANTLDALVRALSIPAASEEVELDGEPAVVLRIEGYEYPARSGQWIVFVAAVHNGRPYVIRLHNRRADTFHLDEVLAGFRFTD